MNPKTVLVSRNGRSFHIVMGRTKIKIGSSEYTVVEKRQKNAVVVDSSGRRLLIDAMRLDPAKDNVSTLMS